MTAPRVVCVIVNFNGRDDTIACARSVLASAEESLEIVIVDNGSTDGSSEALATIDRQVTLLASDKNLGFGAGANLGIDEGLSRGAGFIWLLNNDTLVEPTALHHLLGAVGKDPRIGGAASVIWRMDRPDIEAYGGGSINPWLGTTRPYTHPPTKPLGYLACASALIRRQVFDEIGKFDDIFFAYYEDIDLSIRMKQAGWRLTVSPESSVRHKGGATTNRGLQSRSLWGDLTYVESAGAFLGKHLDARKVIGAPVRLVAMISVRIWRRQFRRLPTVVRKAVRGFKRGLSVRGAR